MLKKIIEEIMNEIIDQNKNAKAGDVVKDENGNELNELVIYGTPNSLLSIRKTDKGYVLVRRMRDEDKDYEFVIGKNEIQNVCEIKDKIFNM